MAEDNLLNFVTSLTGERYLRVEEDLGYGYVRLQVTEAERRQARHDIRSVEDVVVELLRNSRDANASRIFVSTYKDAQMQRIINVIDDGWGIPVDVHDKIFEPRVTGRLDNLVEDTYGVHGRGMALYSIRCNTKEADLICSAPGKGSIFRTVIDTRKLPERKDQSTLPEVQKSHGQLRELRGPHNIPRLLVEFNLEHPELNLYFGSPAEILATMYTLSQPLLPKPSFSEAEIEQFFDQIIATSDLKFWQLSSLAPNALALSYLGKKYYGLEVSERNAYRILSGQIKPLSPLVNDVLDRSKERLAPQSSEVKLKELGVDNLAKYIQSEDLKLLGEGVAKMFEQIGSKYFLQLHGQPEVRREKNQLKILLTLEKNEEI